MESIVLVVHVLAALGVIGLVLLQHGKGADMGAAFGSGASGSLFGVKSQHCCPGGFIFRHQLESGLFVRPQSQVVQRGKNPANNNTIAQSCRHHRQIGKTFKGKRHPSITVVIRSKSRRGGIGRHAILRG
jgi:hypothetical protein